MTMPDRIYADTAAGNDWFGLWHDEREHDSEQVYIRADIVEELVGAMHGVRHYVDGVAGSDEQDAFDAALSRINAIMAGK